MKKPRTSSRKGQPLPRAIVVHSLAHAVAALEAAERVGAAVTLLSPPDFTAYGGSGFFDAIVRRARIKVPAAKSEAVIDCGNAPGLALGALRAGAKAVCFRGRKLVREKIASIAAAHGARLLTVRPRALDLLDVTDARTACAAWLSGKPAGNRSAGPRD